MTVVLDSPRPSVLHVVVNDAPGVFDTSRFDHLQFWLPVLGPGCIALLQTFQVSMSWDVADLAGAIGVKTSKLWHSLDRLTAFGVAAFAGCDTIVVRSELPALSARRLDRLPDHLRFAAIALQTAPELRRAS